VLQIRMDTLGKDHLGVAETNYRIGYLTMKKAPARAMLDFKESLRIRREKLDHNAKEIADTLEMMGRVQTQLGQYDDALTLLVDTLRIRKLHDNHVKLSETLMHIGNVYAKTQEHKLALNSYDECIRIVRNEFGDFHESLADAQFAKGGVLSYMDRIKEAKQAYMEGKEGTEVCSDTNILNFLFLNFALSLFVPFIQPWTFVSNYSVTRTSGWLRYYSAWGK